MIYQKATLGCLTLGVLISLTACGSTVLSPNATYQKFDSTAVVTSQLSGKAFGFSDAIVPAPGIGDATGSLQHDTGAMTLNSPGGSLSDADGMDSNGDLVNDTNVPTFHTDATVGNPTYQNTYEFVQPFTQIGGGQTFGFASQGFIGMGTDVSDMPSAGSAIFNGEAMHATSGQASPATVTANFGTGLVDVSTTQTTGGVIENVSVTGMTVTANGFSGGTFAVTHDGTVVDGSSFGLNTAGEFYGYDTSTGGPDEVGVLISHSGADTAGTIAILAD